MPADEITARFEAAIDARAAADRYVDRDEEREVVQIALQLGYTADAARAALAAVCKARGYVVEGEVVRLVRARVEAAAGGGGRIDRAEFDKIAAAAAEAVGGQRTPRQVRALVVQVMEDTGNTRVKTGWFRDWYKALKRDLGMP